MKTALELLLEHLDPIHEGIRIKAKELLEWEKFTIKKAYMDGRLEKDLPDHWKEQLNPENYFVDKFNGKV